MGTIAAQITSLTIVDSDADKKKSKLRATGLCVGNSPGTSEFPAQMASNAENVSISWRHHGDKHFTAEFKMQIDSFASDRCRIVFIWEIITRTYNYA